MELYEQVEGLKKIQLLVKPYFIEKMILYCRYGIIGNEISI